MGESDEGPTIPDRQQVTSFDLAADVHNSEDQGRTRAQLKQTVRMVHHRPAKGRHLHLLQHLPEAAHQAPPTPRRAFSPASPHYPRGRSLTR